MKQIITLLLIPLWLFSSADTDRALKAMKVEQRIALVIGNDLYDHERLSRLKNPVNDAKAMKSKLEQFGFSVIYGENLRVRDMDRKLDQFTAKLKGGGVGLFFFAGHGVEYQGVNYLMGTDSDIDDKNDVKYESLPVNKVLDSMQDAGNRLNIVLLDACRNDPFSRSSGGGLAKSTAKGTFIAYATSPGDVTSDGSGNNGIFTESILKHIGEPGVPLERVFKKVKRDVVAQTNERQRPWTNSDIIGDFYFVLPAEGSVTETRITYEEKIPAHDADAHQCDCGDCRLLGTWKLISPYIGEHADTINKTIDFTKDNLMTFYPDCTRTDVIWQNSAHIEQTVKWEVKELGYFLMKFEYGEEKYEVEYKYTIHNDRLIIEKYGTQSVWIKQ